MTRKRPVPLPLSLPQPARRGAVGRVVAHSVRLGTMEDARARAASPAVGFTDRVDAEPKWLADQPEVLGPRRN